MLDDTRFSLYIWFIFIMFPLGIWKLIDIIIWLINHVKISFL